RAASRPSASASREGFARRRMRGTRSAAELRLGARRRKERETLADRYNAGSGGLASRPRRARTQLGASVSTMDRPTVLLVGTGERMQAALEDALERHRLMVEWVPSEQ